MQGNRRVVVTGLGVVTALGLDEASFWESMLAGKCGLAPIRGFDTAGYRTTISSQGDDAALGAALKERKLRSTDRCMELALLAAHQALEQAGLVSGVQPPEPRPTATVFGTGGGPTLGVFNATRSFIEKGLDGIRPSTVPSFITNAVSAQISMRFKLKGPNYVIVSACTSSTSAIGTAYRMVADGHIDAVLAGGADAMINPLIFGAWNNLGVMSASPDPEKASRPFDVDRDGLVLGEGAGALVVESLDAALDRGATIRAEICGFGESSDAEHIPRRDPEGQAAAMKAAMDSAGLNPGDVGFINAHGSATPTNDVCETESIRRVLGAAADGVPVASNKSFFGHLLGACGVVETAAVVLGLETGRVPGNRNLENPDPKCDLHLVGKESMDIDAPVALKNSFGFGGHNAVLVLRRWEGS